MDVWLEPDSAVLTVVQAACLAFPAAGIPDWAMRVCARGWATVLPLSIAVVVGAVALDPGVALGLTWVALVLVPLGCVLALGWASRGSRTWYAVLAVPLLGVAWVLPDTRVGQAAACVLVASSAVTLARLLVGVAPLLLIKAGVVVMALVDAVLVFSNSLQAPNAVLVAASPGAGLPQLQSISFGGAGLGYGDLFAAAVVGAIVAAEDGPQTFAALALIPVSLCWDQLFLVYDVLPATVPPAVVLLALEGWRWRTERPVQHPSLRPLSRILT